MNKILVISPALTVSGYGVHSREIISALEKLDNAELLCNLLSWGQCGWLQGGAMKERILSYAAKHANWSGNPTQPPDVTIHVTVPPEFNRFFNTPYIGVTAGIEAMPCHPDWIQKINSNLNHLVVPTKFVKDVFDKTIVQMENKMTGEIREMKVNVPIQVITESVNTELFNDKTECKLDINFEPEFNFLSVCQWGGGNLGEERKNVGNMIKWFKEAFKGNKNVGMVLKINIINNSLMDRQALLRRANDLKSAFNFGEYPKIYLLHDYLEEKDMAQLYRHPKIKAYVSITHGEGFGLPLAEAAASNLPVIATGWSGHTDFLDLGNWVKVNYDMVDVPPMHHGNLFTQGCKWANPKEEDFKRKIRRIVDNYSIPKDWAVDLGAKVRANLNKDVVNNLWKEFLIGNKYLDPDKGKNKLEEVQDFD